MPSGLFDTNLTIEHPLALVIYIYFLLAVIGAWIFTRLRKKLQANNRDIREQTMAMHHQIQMIRSQIRDADFKVKSIVSQTDKFSDSIYFTVLRRLRMEIFILISPYLRKKSWKYRLFIRSLLNSSFQQLRQLKKFL